MDNYYHNLISEVKANMSGQRFEEAIKTLEEEFSMPYIPKEFEDEMITLYNECRHETGIKIDTKKYSEEDIETLLKGGIDEACQAVELLKGSNIRRHLTCIEEYLKKSPHFLVRTLLIEALVEQDIKEEIEMEYDGLDVHFIPTYVEMPADQEHFSTALTMVRDFYESENPSFLYMCVESMMKERFFSLPFPLGEDEVNAFVYAILSYVYEANGDKDGFMAFISEKNLANEGGYDLLLYKYDI